MTGDVPEAALRLLSTLPVHTHEARLPERQLAPQQRPGHTKPKRIVPPRTTKPVCMDGRTYPSVPAAARAVGLSTRAIYKRLARGSAKYVG